MRGIFLSEKFRTGKIKIDRAKKPYIKKVCNISKINVWLVDGEYVRKNICEDFVNYDQHYHLKFIPKNEFWISKEAVPDEIPYYIDRLLTEHRLMSSGVEYNEVISKAAIIEKRERSKSKMIKKLGKLTHRKKLVKKVHKRLLKSYSGKISIWVINGELVRDLFDVDFAGGGHDKVYHYIPPNEVWIDDDLFRDERKFIILHELHERNLMSKGMNYPPAHWSATLIEDFSRHHPHKTIKLIHEEIKKQFDN